MDKITVEEGLILHNRFMFGLALRLTGMNYHDAQDLVSHAVIDALSSKSKWKEHQSGFMSWIRYVILSARHNYYLGKRTVVDALTNNTIDITDDFEIHDHDRSNTELNSVINSLPYPMVARMTYMGYTNEEMQKVLNKSSRAVSVRIKANKEYYNELTRTS